MEDRANDALLSMCKALLLLFEENSNDAIGKKWRAGKTQHMEWPQKTTFGNSWFTIFQIQKAGNTINEQQARPVLESRFSLNSYIYLLCK